MSHAICIDLDRKRVHNDVIEPYLEKGGDEFLRAQSNPSNKD